MKLFNLRPNNSFEVIMAYDLQIMGGFTTGSTLLCGLPLFHCNDTMVTGWGPLPGGPYSAAVAHGLPGSEHHEKFLQTSMSGMRKQMKSALLP
ncbi:MAG: hypothetical protein ACQETR_15890 [Thermodesulfobacteriota bacterium]